MRSSSSDAGVNPHELEPLRPASQAVDIVVQWWNRSPPTGRLSDLKTDHAREEDALEASRTRVRFPATPLWVDVSAGCGQALGEQATLRGADHALMGAKFESSPSAHNL